MNEAEQQITLAYLRGYGDITKPWSSELHLAGLKEVFRAGADAQRRKELVADTVQEENQR